jgi:AraC family transcriptional regulator
VNATLCALVARKNKIGDIVGFKGENSKKEYSARIHRVIDYIKLNSNEDLSLDKLSSIAHFSKFYFHRIFKAITGENLNSFVNRVRIERSAFLLIYNNESITNIAYLTGFSSPAVYSRTFRQRYNLTPSQWRRAKVHHKSNICKTNSNACEAQHEITLYIDSSTKQPHWRVCMSNQNQINVKVCNMPDIHIAYVRHTGSYNPQDKLFFQSLFSRLMAWAVPRNLFNPPQTKAFTVYSGGHPETTNPENLSVEVCISIEPNASVEGEIGKRVIPKGAYAMVSLSDVTVQECALAWDTLFNHWLPESGFQPSDGAYYVNHLNDPEQHPKKLHSVEMYLPVKPL